MARPKKSEHFKIRRFENKVRDPAKGMEKNRVKSISWQITGTKPNGDRIRKNFAEHLDAVQAKADLEAEYNGHVVATPVQRTRLTIDQLADAEAALHNAGTRKIADIVAHYLNLETRAKSKGINLDAALAFVESHFRTESVAISVLNAVAGFKSSRHDASPATTAYYEATLKLLIKSDPNKFVHSITVVDIERILNRFTNANSRRTHRGAFSTFFGWCVRHHYCLENPCKRLDKLPKDMSQIAALSLKECKRLLYAATQLQDGAAVAVIAIGLFAGLRPSEIRDLKPDDILADKIRVSGGKMRRKLKRTTPISPVLASWLKEYPFAKLPKGWSYKMKALKKATKARKWVSDIIRHTSITFQTERDKNEALTAYNCGTSIQMMNRHYRDTIDDEKTVTEFWDLTPAKLLAKTPEIELPGKPKIDWPDNKALAELVWQKPLIHAAKDIGVSDVALRKHCVKVGIELPKQGHWVRQQQLAGKK